MGFSTTGLVDLIYFYLTTSFLSCGKTSFFQYQLQAVLHHRLFSLQRYGCPGRLQAPPKGLEALNLFRQPSAIRDWVFRKSLMFLAWLSAFGGQAIFYARKKA